MTPSGCCKSQAGSADDPPQCWLACTMMWSCDRGRTSCENSPKVTKTYRGKKNTHRNETFGCFLCKFLRKYKRYYKENRKTVTMQLNPVKWPINNGFKLSVFNKTTTLFVCALTQAIIYLSNQHFLWGSICMIGLVHRPMWRTVPNGPLRYTKLNSNIHIEQRNKQINQ